MTTIAKPIKICSNARTRQVKAEDGTYTARSEDCDYSWVAQAYAIKQAGADAWQAYPTGVPAPE